MRREVWLRSNRRFLPWLLLLPSLLVVAGGLLATWSEGSWALWVGGVICLLGMLVAVMILIAEWEPRLSYRAGWLGVNLGPGRPTRVPLEVVECFFLGHADLPGAQGKETRISTVVMRLAESATHWKSRPVSARLGRWCDGYVVFYGLWCEPLNVAIVERLNHRLVAVRRQARRDAEERDAMGGQATP